MHISIGLNEWWTLIFDILVIGLIFYTYFKRRKMSTVLLKFKPTKISTIIVLGIGSLVSIIDLVYYLFLQKINLQTVIDKSKGLLFCMLLLYCFVYTDRITEKGIALSDTLLEWQNIESWSWIDNSLQILMIDVLEDRRHKINKEKSNIERKICPNQKESIDRILKQYIPEKNRN